MDEREGRYDRCLSIPIVFLTQARDPQSTRWRRRSVSSPQAMAGLERAWVQAKPEGGQKGRSHRGSTQPHPISTHSGASTEMPSPELANPFFPTTPCAGCNNTLLGTNSPEHAAPHAGAWLEIACSAAWCRRAGVTPHAGTWSGMGMPSRCQAAGPIPHIVRGSKYRCREWRDLPCRVTPYVGKWTERTPSSSRSRPPPAPLCGCAE